MNFRLVIDWAELNQYDSAAIEHAQEYVSRLQPIYPLGPIICRAMFLEGWNPFTGGGKIQIGIPSFERFSEPPGQAER